MSRNIWLFYCYPGSVGPSGAPCTRHDAGRAEGKVKFRENVLIPVIENGECQDQGHWLYFIEGVHLTCLRWNQVSSLELTRILWVCEKLSFKHISISIVYDLYQNPHCRNSCRWVIGDQKMIVVESNNILFFFLSGKLWQMFLAQWKAPLKSILRKQPEGTKII